MADVPQRIWAEVETRDGSGNPVSGLWWNMPSGGVSPYILATPEALAAAPEVQALIRAAKAEGMREAAGMVTLGDTVTRTQARIIAAAASAERG